VPLSNQVTTLNHKRFKGFKMFSDGHLGLQFKARILRDREQPGRFEVLLGSLTTTRPIVPQNYSPARIRFIPAARINPIFCYQCYLRDRYGRLAFLC